MSPKLIIVSRHCEKIAKGEKLAMGLDKFKFKNDTGCSPKGYARADKIPESLDNLLSTLGEQKITKIYVTGSQENNKRCARSLRMKQSATPLANTLGLSMNTNFCAGDQKLAAQDILRNSPNDVVMVFWEHKNIAGLMRWILTLSSASRQLLSKVPVWPDDVFDQYWIIDLRGSPNFFIRPHNIFVGLEDTQNIFEIQDGSHNIFSDDCNSQNLTENKNVIILIILSIFLFYYFAKRKT